MNTIEAGKRLIKRPDNKSKIGDRLNAMAAPAGFLGGSIAAILGGDGEEQEILNDILEREANEEELTEDEVLLLKLLRSE